MELTIGHVSMQWSDSKEQKQSDLKKIFEHANSRNYAWITGTEANHGLAPMIKTAAEVAGFTFFNRGEQWLAVRTKRISSGWETEWTKVVGGVAGRYPDRSVIRASFKDAWLGVVTVLCSHYQTQSISREAARKGDNEKIAAEITRMANAHGGGTAKVFYGGDQNITDNKHDSFFGGPLTSCWDELGEYPKTTGWGTIDVIASYNPDKAVKCKSARAWNDTDLPLNTDHYLIEATYSILKTPDPKPKPPAPQKLASPPVYDGSPAKHSGLGNKPINRIVIHSAVMPCEPGRAKQLGEMNSKGQGGGSWHYATDPNMTYQTSYDSYVCWHAPPNPHSLAIEMADYPRPWPSGKWTAKWWAKLQDMWRWRKPEQMAMLKRTADLTAELCYVYDIPVRMLSVNDLRAGRRGIATHAKVSQAFKQSTHWDPGAWPYRKFLNMVKAHYATLKD